MTVNIAPPSGSAAAVTTDETGTWQSTAYGRGTYNVTVNLPSGGAFTTATSTSFTASPATNLILAGGSSGAPYVQNATASQWNPVTGSYSAWIAALATTATPTGDPFIDFANVATSPTGNGNVVNSYLVDEVISRFDSFIGKWTSDGTPSLAVAYIIGTEGGGRGTRSRSQSRPSAGGMQFPSQGGSLDAVYALSYDPTQPDYSTVASIDNTGQVTIWKYNPTTLGNGTTISPGPQTFKLTQGTPVKMVGYNKAGSDHFQSQDLAVVYRDANGRARAGGDEPCDECHHDVCHWRARSHRDDCRRFR